MPLINILNPISEINVPLDPPGYAANVDVIGTLKIPPHEKQIIISFDARRSTSDCNGKINGDLTIPPGYFCPFVGPGFWPPSDPDTTHLETWLTPIPPWDTIDMTINLTLFSPGGVAATITLFNFKAEIEGLVDHLPVLGVG